MKYGLQNKVIVYINAQQINSLLNAEISNFMVSWIFFIHSNLQPQHCFLHELVRSFRPDQFSILSHERHERMVHQAVLSLSLQVSGNIDVRRLLKSASNNEAYFTLNCGR